MNCIIIDDEPLAREGMELNIKELDFLNLVHSFPSAIKANSFLMENSIDLIFLDIEMPGLNGLDFIRTLNQKPLIILSTAYPQHALEAFELDVLDYLVKPIRFERFVKAVSKAKEVYDMKQNPLTEISLNKTDDFMFIKADRKMVKLFYKDVSFIKGMKDYVIVHSTTGKFMTAMNIKTINSQLPDEIFARVSKSYIINVNKLKTVELDLIQLEDHEIPLGNSYKKAFIEKYIKGNLIDRK